MASMTGFARVRGTHGSTQFAWELKSVNGRGFDVRVRLPSGFDGIEPTVRDVLARHVVRGNVQATLVVDRPPRPVDVMVATPVLDALLRAAEAIRARTGGPAPSVDALLQLPGVVTIVEEPESDEERAALHGSILAGLGEAAEALAAARREEGAKLAALIAGHVNEIERLTQAADTHPSRRPETIKARLAEQLAILLDAREGLDPDRLHQEAVLIANKVDVREEIDRLLAHVAHARSLLGEGGPVGRKYDFLAQEFNREANTLCSKSNDRELTAIGLSLKTTIDQLRKQIQNVE
jgi:uncharacterized protein (TIGR00255 family)